MNTVSYSHYLDTLFDEYRSDIHSFESICRLRVLSKYLKGPEILDVGIGDGLITNFLASHFPSVVAVDGSLEAIKNCKEKFATTAAICFEHTLFENFTTTKKFSDIVMSNLLEHVDDPVSLLTKSLSLLQNGGYIHLIVPNAHSFHRLVGKEMGMIQSLTEITEVDLSWGHKRVYTYELLTSQVNAAGLRTLITEGILFKTLSTKQLVQLDKTVLEGFFSLGNKFKEQSAYIYFCAAP